MANRPNAILRLHMPQWQGGNRHEYHFGSRLLSWLAPEANGPVEIVPVPGPVPGESLAVENGIVARRALLDQARAARRAIDKHRPDRIVTFGGDCLADLAPLAYLNTRYEGKLGVLWIDAHPDVLTPETSAHGHTYVLAALLGEGDADLVGEVETTVQGSRVMLAGLNELTATEAAVINSHGVHQVGAKMLAGSSAPVLDWIAREGITHLGVHFDVDVLDARRFGPVLFNDPATPAETWDGIPKGQMTPGQVVRLLRDVAAACDVVGLAITEYLPWEAIQTRDLLRQLPLLGGEDNEGIGAGE